MLVTRGNWNCGRVLEANMTFTGELNQDLNAPTGESPKAAEKMPAAGPHARPELTNFDACPGAGALPSEMELSGESDPGAG
jgi:hypothetical protein